MLNAIGAIAGREFRALLLSLQGLGVWAIFGLTYALAVSQAQSFSVLAQFATVERALSAMNALDLFLVPFAGILLGYGAIASELELGTASFLASKPIPRASVVVGKFLGRTGYLAAVWAIITVGAMAWIGAIVGGMRANVGEATNPAAILGSLDGAVLYPISLLALATSFLGIGLLVSALTRRTGAALSLGIAVYAGFGIAWNALFSVGQEPDVTTLTLKLLSPFVAWLEWSNRLLGQSAPWMQRLTDDGTTPLVARPEFYVLVLVMWLLGCVALAAWRFGRRDLA
ncbi:MAG: ABC transporter permease [Candidatus Bipolaricaulia bacterium]